jgi:biopolymer transport protein ExbD
MNERRYLQRREPRLNIIPMIDVMMFLLVFFVLIVFHSIPDSGIDVNLPAATHTNPLPRKNVVVNVDSRSEVSVQGRRVAVDHLASYLLSLHDSQHLSVILAGDRALPLRDLVHVMSAIRASGVRNVDIAVRGQRN